jgi:site-specific DNA-cytosine methylase
MKLCIDLEAGLRGFSSAFLEAGWEVVSVDIDPKFGSTITADILTLTAAEIEAKTKLGSFALYEKVVVVASPPCERFSIANSNWPQKGIRKALEIVGATIELIADIKPDYWLLENPKGRLRWFLGAPPHSVKLSDYGHNRTIQGGKLQRPYKPTDLWGNVPFQLLEGSKEVKPLKESISRARRAEMPKGLSQAVLQAVEAIRTEGA